MRWVAAALSILLTANSALATGFWATPVPLGPGQPPGAPAGQLVFRGGLQLAAEDKRFGGLSGLCVSSDLHVTAISDRGYFVHFALVEAGDGTLEGVGGLRIEPLQDSAGTDLRRLDRDAEDVAALPDGRRIVVFERNARLGWFRPNSAREERTLSLLDLVGSGNEGIEAIVPFPDGRILLIAERLGHWDGIRRAWIGHPGDWQGFDYVSVGNEEVVSAALLPDGDLLVLQRAASPLTGFSSRLVRIPGGAIRPGARVSGDVLVELGPPGIADNFEGIAVRPVGDGRAAIYLVSDDNYFALQRTYLLKFELAAP